MVRFILGVAAQASHVTVRLKARCQSISDLIIFCSMFNTGIEFILPVPDDSVPLSDTTDTSRLVEYSLRCSLDLIVKPTDLYRTF